MNILDKIVAEKRREVAEAKARTPLASLRSQAEARKDVRDFKAAIEMRDSVALIAEVKKASPSAGLICDDYDPVSIAKQYERSGASACSVLTDQKFFQGDLSFLRSIRDSTRIPLLRKDFIIDEYQIYESAAAGADAILLIVSILDAERLRRFLKLAEEYRLAALVEIHDEAEKEIALNVGAEIIGINNRDLKDFTVSLATTERLAKGIDGKCVLVAESGIHTRADVERVRAAGVDAVLVGESLMRSGNIESKIHELIGSAHGAASHIHMSSNQKVKVKICGITVLDDALCAVEAGADMLGFIFWGPSPRCVEPEAVKLLAEMLPQTIQKVGVFVDASAEEVNRIADDANLDVVQLHGKETPQLCKELRRSYKVWKAFRMKDASVLESMRAYEADAFLLDGYVKDKPGGTGQIFDWELASGARDLGIPIVLSGGLASNNVLEALKTNPYALDVSSGVESTPGKKDHDKIRKFLKMVASGR